VEKQGCLHIGALVSLEELSKSDLVRQKTPLLAQAAFEVGSPLLRTRGTLGGNLCLDNRCKFFNQSEFWRSSNPPCYKAGGTRCLVTNREKACFASYLVTNREKACFASYSGDTAPALIAMGARIVLSGEKEDRVINLRDFYTMESKHPHLLSDQGQEVLSEIQVPIPGPGNHSVYLKYRRRKSIDFPEVGVAISLDMDGSICRAAAIVLTGVGSGPLMVEEVNQIIVGQALTENTVSRSAEAASRAARPIKTGMLSPQYKRRLVSDLTREGLMMMNK
jgi:4-hydroxybenzoyl-CoA reductase subunit beta